MEKTIDQIVKDREEAKLRDNFAIAAMQAFLLHNDITKVPPSQVVELVPEAAYDMAEAMLAVRAKRK